MKLTNRTECSTVEVNGEIVIALSDGNIVRKIRHASGHAISSGCKDGGGYMHLNVNKRNMAVHRIIAKAFLGDFSDDLDVDHINGDRLDNRLENIRMVTRSENQRAYRGNYGRSKYRGVCLNGGRWRARILGEHLGAYGTEEEAAEAYNFGAIAIGFSDEALNVIINPKPTK